MPKPKFVTDTKLQKLADKKDSNEVANAADYHFQLDVNDCDDVAGSVEHGIEVGLILARRLRKLKRDSSRRPDPSVGIYKITFPDYGDDDGLAYFVGSRGDVQSKLERLAKGDNDEDEEENDED